MTRTSRIITIVLSIVTVTTFAVACLVVLHATVANRNAVDSPCTATYYKGADGNLFKVFRTCAAAPGHAWFRAVGHCAHSNPVGNWQNQPGPWYGSTAQCPGDIMVGSSIQFSG